MTLAEALAAAHAQYNREVESFVLDDGPARSEAQVIYELAVVEEFTAITNSEAYRIIVQLAVEHVPSQGVIDSIEEAAVIALRFGMRTQRILQSANAQNPQPANASHEERRTKKEKE
jgi:hypothetical protein